MNPEEMLEKSEAQAVAAAESSQPDKSQKMKEHFKRVYDMVGERAAKEASAAPPSAARIANARVVVSKLGYTTEQMDILGDDIVHMQGTGNPHLVAKLAPGEHVVDLGSGLGVDAHLASAAVGNSGHVIGIDQSDQEVFAAITRTAARGLINVDFRIGDMENVPVPDGSVDCVLSNGGFCLVPDKLKAFKEIYRILKPGGRFAINCTVGLVDLDPSIKWPSCFHVFMALKDVSALVTGAGFPEPGIAHPPPKEAAKAPPPASEGKKCPVHPQEKAEDKPKAFVHRGSSTYAHLGGMDMDSMFKYVTISATKPAN